MADVLIIGDTSRSPELRHEVPLARPRPVRLPRARRCPARLHPLDGGRPDPRARSRARRASARGGRDRRALRPEPQLSARCASNGPSGPAPTPASPLLSVPQTFPAGHLDRLRRAGIELTVDQPLFDARRRVKAGPELDGIRRAQGAAEAGAPGRPSPCCERQRTATASSGSAVSRSRSSASRRRCGSVFAERGCSAAGVHRRAGPAGRGGTRDGPRADPVRRAGRLRPVAAGRRVVLLRRHDPDARRSARSPTRCASGTRLTKDALDTATALMSRPAWSAAPSSTPPARSTRRPATRPSARRPTARCCDHGFFHGLGTASGSRCTNGRAWAASPRHAARRRRRDRSSPASTIPPSAASAWRISSS